MLSTSIALCAHDSRSKLPEKESKTKAVKQKLPQVIRNLNDAIIAAYLNNPTLQSVRQQAREQNERVVQAQAGWLPTVEGKAGLARNQNINSRDAKAAGTSQTETTDKQAGLTVRHNLFNGFATKAGVEASNQASRSIWAQTLSKEQKTLLDVVETYLNLIKLKAEIATLKASQAAFKKNYESAVDKMNIGEETKTQVALAEARLMDADAKLEIATANYEGTKATLFSLTGITSVDNLEHPEFTYNTPKTLNEYLNIAAKDNPDVIASEYDYAASKAEIDVRSREYYPSVDLVASTTRKEDNNYGYRGGGKLPGRNGFSRNYMTNNSIGVEVSYKFFDGGSTASVSRAAYEQSISKKVLIEQARYTAKQTAIQNWQNLKAAIQNVKFYEKQVAAYDVSLKGTQEELGVGTKILLDVLERQTDLLNAQLLLIDSKKNLLLEQFKMLAILGKLTPKMLKLNASVESPEDHYKKLVVS